MNTEIVKTISQYKKEPVEADRIQISVNIDKDDRLALVDELILKKVAEGKQIVIEDDKNQYRNRLQEKLNRMGVETYTIDPSYNFRDSDSIDIMSVLKNEPGLYNKWKESLEVASYFLTNDIWTELMYYYYMESTDPDKYDFAEFIDTIENAKNLTYEDFNNSKLPKTSQIYRKIFYKLMQELSYSPDKVASVTASTHSYLVALASREPVTGLFSNKERCNAVKEVFSGRRKRRIPLEEGCHRNRVIFLNSDHLDHYSESISASIAALFKHLEPSTVAVMDDSFIYNCSIMPFPFNDKSYIVSDSKPLVTSELLILPERENQNHEEHYLYGIHHKFFDITYSLWFILRYMFQAFLIASAIMIVAYMFVDVLPLGESFPSELKLTEIASATKALFVPAYMMSLVLLGIHKLFFGGGD